MSRAPLAIVLHTHMPYVEGFGTWPFGEEWLWEAIATCYLPLLDVLDAAPGRITLSLTPVLADQLEAPGALERCLRFLRELRAETHRRDIASASPDVAAVLERSRDPLRPRGGRARAPRRSPRRVRPARDLDVGGDARAAAPARHRRRRAPAARDRDRGAPRALRRLGRRAVAARVRLRAVARRGARGGRRARGVRGLHRPGARPPAAHARRARCSCRSTAPPSTSCGASAAIRAGRRTATRTRSREYRHCAWAIGGAVYDEAAAERQARADARDFVARARGVCALDTELLGHFWHEGPAWLAAVIEEAGDRAAPARRAAGRRRAGAGRPAGHELGQRRATCPPGAARRPAGWPGASARPSCGWPGRRERALRELLALQSSDWAFLIARGTAGDYPRERFEGHCAAFEHALGGRLDGPLRNLAPHMP